MVKKLLAMLVACVMMFGFALPASALQSAGLPTLETASENAYVYVESEGQQIYQGQGVTWVYDLDNLAQHAYEYDWNIEVSSIEGAGLVSCERVADADARFSITAKRVGKATLTCTETWTEDDDWWDDEEDDCEPVQQSETHVFTINVVALTNTSGALVGCVSSSYSSQLFTFKLSGLPADADVELVSDSNKKGSSWVDKVASGKVTLSVYGVGTHNIKLKACGKTVTCKAILRVMSLKATADVKDTGSLVTYPGHKSTLGITLTGVKNPKATWTSSNKKVAQVSKKGVVKATGKGRCYLTAKVGGSSVKVLAEVTSKGAYQAVKNGFVDMKTKLTYSQPNRMAAKCRDCSSFVSRCYWDPSLGRRTFLIGDSGAANWAYNASAQARWLEAQGKRVALKACSTKKLRPGDTIYFETDYAGKDASQWRYIDHAALYVGNGRYLNTGGYGGKGTVGLASYYEKDPRVKFIGRPLS